MGPTLCFEWPSNYYKDSITERVGRFDNMKKGIINILSATFVQMQGQKRTSKDNKKEY